MNNHSKNYCPDKQVWKIRGNFLLEKQIWSKLLVLLVIVIWQNRNAHRRFRFNFKPIVFFTSTGKKEVLTIPFINRKLQSCLFCKETNRTHWKNQRKHLNQLKLQRKWLKQQKRKTEHMSEDREIETVLKKPKKRRFWLYIVRASIYE